MSGKALQPRRTLSMCCIRNEFKISLMGTSVDNLFSGVGRFCEAAKPRAALAARDAAMVCSRQSIQTPPARRVGRQRLSRNDSVKTGKAGCPSPPFRGARLRPAGGTGSPFSAWSVSSVAPANLPQRRGGDTAPYHNQATSNCVVPAENDRSYPHHPTGGCTVMTGLCLISSPIILP